MPILKRLYYALVVLIAVTMIVGLTMSIAEGVGVIHGVSVQRVMSHPLYFTPIFLIGFALAPWLSEHFLVSGDPPNPNPSGKPPFGYAVRTLALVALGLVLAALANLVVFLLGKVS